MTNGNQEVLLPYLKTGIALLAFICLAILVYVLHQAGDLLIPFVVAVLIYMLLQPVIQLLEKWRMPRALVTLLAMGVTMVVVWGMSQVIYQSIAAFTGGLSQYEGRFNDIWQRIGSLLGVSPDALSGGWNIADDPRIAEFLNGATITDLVKLLLASVNSLLSNLVLVFIFLLLLLLGRDMLPKKLKYAFSQSLAGRLTDMTQGIRANIQKYLVIKTIIGLLAAGVVMLITLVFGLDFVIVWGILTYFLSFIPNIGSIVASVLPFLFALVQFDTPMTAVWIGVSIFAVKFSIGNLLEPRLMGRSIDLSPLLIMFSLIFWGSIWGIVGMFLSIPLTAIVKIVFDNVKPLRPIGILMGEDVRGETTAPA
ncbi:MAG TPA: AI-2E family transporter [Bacteroidota bacterium]|nr:AI-2E family transporter [Bacteroidota bacterium]